MPVDSLMPKKKSGTTGYLVAAAVMFAAMGGLIFWKTSQGAPDPSEPNVPPPPSQTQAAAPALEAPPPPPPPKVEEEKDAGTDAPATKAVKGAGSGAYGCSAKVCQGTAGADLRGALQGKAGQARSCYQNALRNNSTLTGRLTVAVRVGPNGMACSASVASDELGDPQVSNCVTRLFRAGKFPPPKGGCVDTVVPMNFVPKQ